MLDGEGHALALGEPQGPHSAPPALSTPWTPRPSSRPRPGRHRHPTSTDDHHPVHRRAGPARRDCGGDRQSDPSWARPGLLGLLAATAVLLFWGLTASGWANAFYSAAVQAGSASWKAFFFGSSDAANSITVDKPPASLWVMALSVRVFGLSSLSILVPEALMGVATVGGALRHRASAGSAPRPGCSPARCSR